MRLFGNLVFAALVLGVSLGAHASAPDAAGAGIAAAAPFTLNTEIVVKNWILCMSQSFAEEVVRAREAGEDEALAKISALQADRSCGRFAEMRVILHEPLVVTSPFATAGARAFSAEISLDGRWIPAFVIDARLRG
jgi:hypothetical protein